jgi:predicted metal-dependent phosphoesterase TrpH
MTTFSPTYVDLHLHSTYSDGVHSPAAVVRLAAEEGLAAVALCDHDNIDGIDEAMAAGRERGVEVLSGVELSTVWEDFRDIHLLGYGFDHHHPGLRAALAEFQAFRAGRNERIVGRVNEKLREMGKDPIDFRAVLASAGGTVGRPHIARALIEKNVVRDTEEAFLRFLVPCNVPKRFFPIDEAIALVHDAGGVAVLAHPSFVTPHPKALETLLDTFISLGLEGVEAYHSGAGNDEIDRLITLARRRGLLVTGGSDFHGTAGAGIVVGRGRGNLKIPYACLEEIRQALARRKRDA